MTRPIIGIVPALTPEDHQFIPEPAYRFEYIKQHYYEVLEEQGATPVILPASERHDNVTDYCELISGLLLVGGEDVNPSLYGEELDKYTSTLPPRRDLLERRLVQECCRRKIPILAICRGMQMLNVAFGGTLYQDLSHCRGAGDHRQQGELDFSTSHQVQVVAGTMLHQILNCDMIETNTGHHQAIRHVGEGLIVAARALDGVIEALEGDGFIIGVQWHPESWPADQISRRLFTAFGAAARRPGSGTYKDREPPMRGA